MNYEIEERTAIDFRTELEEKLTSVVNDFQIKTGLIVDEISLTFEGVRVDLMA